MSGEEAQVRLTFSGDAAAFLKGEAARHDVTPDEIGRRALALYGVLAEHLAIGGAVLLRPLESEDGLPDLVRVDLFAREDRGDDPFGDITAVRLERPFRSRLMPWPPIDQ